MKQVYQLKAKAQQHGDDSAHRSLQNLEGKLHDCILHGAVEKGSAKGIANYHDDGPEEDTDPCCQGFPSGKEMTNAQGDHYRLKPMGGKGYKHGSGIKEEISQKGADATHDKGAERI